MNKDELASYLYGVYHTTLANAHKQAFGEVRTSLIRIALEAAKAYSELTGRHPTKAIGNAEGNNLGS